MKKIIPLLIIVVLMLSLSGCGCKHEWAEATCNEPKTCTLCGKTQGEPLGHQFSEATCISPKVCEICGETEGEAWGHIYNTDGLCDRCGEKDPNFFNPASFGFLNNYGMGTLIEISEYSLEGEVPTVSWETDGYRHGIVKFNNNVFYYYSRYEHDHNPKDVTEDLSSTTTYKIISNDAISLGNGTTLTIIDRIYDDDGHIILKMMWDNEGYSFVLKEQIDWTKSPAIRANKGNDLRHGGKLIYYFQ